MTCAPPLQRAVLGPQLRQLRSAGRGDAMVEVRVGGGCVGADQVVVVVSRADLAWNMVMRRSLSPSLAR